MITLCDVQASCVEFESNVEEYKLKKDIGQVIHPRQQVREPVHRCAVWSSEDIDVLLNVDASGHDEVFQSTPASPALTMVLLTEKKKKKKHNLKVENYVLFSEQNWRLKPRMQSLR